MPGVSPAMVVDLPVPVKAWLLHAEEDERL